MIKLTNIQKNYGKNEVLKSISMTIAAGEITGIVGANGAGKTTLFHCVAGMLPFTGDIDYDGGSLREHLGFLPTHPVYLSKLTGSEYLRLTCLGAKQTVPNLDLCNVFNLPLHRYAADYSTGMKKKLAITAILLQKNDVFIFDEPFNGVDIQSNMLIQTVIRKLKERGKTVLISSHIFSTLAETCDVLHHLKEGRIHRTALPDEFDSVEADMAQGDHALNLEVFDL